MFSHHKMSPDLTHRGLYRKQEFRCCYSNFTYINAHLLLQSIYMCHAPFIIVKIDSYMVLYRRGIITELFYSSLMNQLTSYRFVFTV